MAVQVGRYAAGCCGYTAEGSAKDTCLAGMEGGERVHYVAPCGAQGRLLTVLLAPARPALLVLMIMMLFALPSCTPALSGAVHDADGDCSGPAAPALPAPGALRWVVGGACVLAGALLCVWVSEHACMDSKLLT